LRSFTDPDDPVGLSAYEPRDADEGVRACIALLAVRGVVEKVSESRRAREGVGPGTSLKGSCSNGKTELAGDRTECQSALTLASRILTARKFYEEFFSGFTC